LQLEIQAFPEDGVEWLFVRVEAKRIKQGRMDLEIIIMDESRGREGAGKSWLFLIMSLLFWMQGGMRHAELKYESYN
jgi:hypothetical protein